MSDKTENLFSRMMGRNPARFIEGRVAEEEAKFEEARVRFVLREFKLTAVIPSLLRDQALVAGRPTLTFSAFADRFPSFPFLFGTSVLRLVEVPWSRGAVGGRTSADYVVHRDPYSTEPARYSKFGWVPFVIAYANFYESMAAEANGRRIGLIYPRTGLRDGMVIHNDESEQFWTSGLVQVYKDPDTQTRLYVQPFSALIKSIYASGRGWHL